MEEDDDGDDDHKEEDDVEFGTRVPKRIRSIEDEVKASLILNQGLYRCHFSIIQIKVCLGLVAHQAVI